MDKQTLLEYCDIINEIKHLDEERKDIFLSGGTPKAPDGMPHASGTSDPTSSAGVRAAVIKQQIDYNLDRLIAIRREAEAALNSLSSAERDIIRLRYFRGMEWKDIFPEVNYSEREVYRKHKESLAKIANMAVGDS